MGKEKDTFVGRERVELRQVSQEHKTVKCPCINERTTGTLQSSPTLLLLLLHPSSGLTLLCNFRAVAQFFLRPQSKFMPNTLQFSIDNMALEARSRFY